MIKVIGELLGSEKKDKTEAAKSQKKECTSNTSKPESKKPETKEVIQRFPDFKPTNIGMTFDAEYHVKKKIRSYWKQYYGEEEDLNLSDVLKGI